jgi:hypothetical protein
MNTDEIQLKEKTRIRLSDHPWISLVALWVVGLLVLIKGCPAVNLLMAILDQ